MNIRLTTLSEENLQILRKIIDDNWVVRVVGIYYGLDINQNSYHDLSLDAYFLYYDDDDDDGWILAEDRQSGLSIHQDYGLQFHWNAGEHFLPNIKAIKVELWN